MKDKVKVTMDTSNAITLHHVLSTNDIARRSSQLRFNLSTLNEYADLLISDGEEHMIAAMGIFWLGYVEKYNNFIILRCVCKSDVFQGFQIYSRRSLSQVEARL
nr:AlNc14C456G11764 [Albugo laibachii Nc14]|eukprot:CCA27106.1 AlNc14C456G11764 [Albugo laibachii Nc14]